MGSRYLDRCFIRKVMNYFDKIFVVSLDNEVGHKRMEITGRHLQEQGISYFLWEATEDENGVVGLLKSMHSLFVQCIKEQLKSVLVLEDDNFFVLPVVPALKEIMPQLPSDYHCLFLSCNLLSRPERVSQNILRIRSSYSTNAIVYSLEAMKLIVPLIEKYPTTAYDIILMREIQQQYNKCYCTIPMLSNQRAGYSSIEKREIDWAAYQAQSFMMYTKNI